MNVTRPERSFRTESFLSINTTNHGKITPVITLLSPYPTSPQTRRTPKPPFANPLPARSSGTRSIGWSSAYILIRSRVVGSGIFAIPGVIAQSAGSIGVSLLWWFAGAVVASCCLAAVVRIRSSMLTGIAVQAALLGFYSQQLHRIWQIHAICVRNQCHRLHGLCRHRGRHFQTRTPS